MSVPAAPHSSIAPLPQLRGGIAVTAISVFLEAWNEFAFAVVIGGNRVRTVTVVIFNFISVEQTPRARLAAAAMLAMSPVIVIGLVAQRHIVKGLTVLHGVSLAIEPDEFLVLLGPSGSGKTTTLRIPAGLEFGERRPGDDGRHPTSPHPSPARATWRWSSRATLCSRTGRWRRTSAFR